MTKMINTIEELDSTWITDYENDYKKYKYFYQEELTTITIFFMYIDEKNNLFKIKEKKINIKDKKISKEQLLYLIKNNRYPNSNKFKLDYILRYNITIEPENITKFIKIDNNVMNTNYLQVIKTCEDIYYNNTINILKNLNCLYLIYSPNNSYQTKKIYITNKTSKTHRKTKRK
jgi:hypothetical protein